MHPQLVQILYTQIDKVHIAMHFIKYYLDSSLKLQKGISACWADTSTDFSFPFLFAFLFFSSEALVSTHRFY